LAFSITGYFLKTERRCNPMRGFPAGDCTEVVFSLVQRPEMSDEEFAGDAEWVAKDLASLKALLEVA
jgi:hypothetical protein